MTRRVFLNSNDLLWISHPILGRTYLSWGTGCGGRGSLGVSFYLLWFVPLNKIFAFYKFSCCHWIHITEKIIYLKMLYEITGMSPHGIVGGNKITLTHYNSSLWKSLCRKTHLKCVAIADICFVFLWPVWNNYTDSPTAQMCIKCPIDEHDNRDRHTNSTVHVVTFHL